jgi:hypothetical protein
MFTIKTSSLSRFILKTTTIILFSFFALQSQSYQDMNTKISYPWQLDIAKKKNKTVLDYFYLLPSDFLDCERTENGLPSLSIRKKQVTFIDEKNGYLEFFKSSQMALFKSRKDSLDIVVLQTGKSGAGCSCGSINDAFQFIPEKNIWIPRKDLFPSGYKHDELYNKYVDLNILPFFKLPKKGFTIEIADEAKHDSVIGSLRWNGERFAVFSEIKQPK